MKNNRFRFIFKNDSLIAIIESSDSNWKNAQQALIEHLTTKEIRLVQKSETEFHSINHDEWELISSTPITSSKKLPIGIKITIKQSQ